MENPGKIEAAADGGAIVALVLCGGKGARMSTSTEHKVCFPINGVPSVHRTVNGLREAGIDRFCIVLGTMAGRVAECIGASHEGVLYAYQPQPLGAGDAVRAGAAALRPYAAGSAGILVAMGDRIVSPGLLRRLVARFRESGADAVVTCVPADGAAEANPVILDSAGRVERIGRGRDAAPGAGARLYRNGATYLFRPESLFRALDAIGAAAGSGELFVSDIVNRICAGAREDGSPAVVDSVTADTPHDVLSFETVDELLAVEDLIRRREAPLAGPPGAPRLRPVSEWIELFRTMPPALGRLLRGIYGSDEAFVEERRRAYLRALEAFSTRYGAGRSAVIARSPGRINLMGRHVEHRGGFINVMSLDREILCVAAPRDDGTFRLANVLPEFPDGEFRLEDHLAMLKWQQWTDYLEAKETRDLVTGSRGRWENYVKAAVLRLQHTHKDRRLRGMDAMYYGNIPMAAGLSSSSAVVVATAEAVIAVNGLDVSPQDFVDLCGEGEWFVGSRGGAGDHAAMKFGDRGAIAQLGFFPFRLERRIPFPKGTSLIIADSHVKAKKTTNARDVFNQRVAEYELAFMIFHERHPRHQPLLQRLRDINVRALRVPPSAVFEMLRAVPESATLEEIRGMLPPSLSGRIDVIAATHAAPERYSLLPVLLYGVCECERSRVAADQLERGDLDALGELMRISHDGDRVVTHDDSGAARPFVLDCGDAYLSRLVDDLRSEDPDRVAAAQIRMQSGAYACSTPETDFLVDAAARVDGVIGAQLSGAGLGGCVMILARESAVERVIFTLGEKYYAPRSLEPAITVCAPVKGSMTLELT